MSSRQPDLHKSVPTVPTSGGLTATMLASATASMLSRVPCHPLDTCKAKLQVGAKGGLLGVLRDTLRAEGLRGLYRGFGAAFVGSGPAGCLYFTTYELAKGSLLSTGPVGQSPFIAHFTAGLLAEFVSCVLWVPIDVVKERLQVQSTLAAGSKGTPPAYAYTGNVHAALTILRAEGLRGLYRGYGATVLSFGPFSALYFMYYEQLKRLAEALTTTPDPERSLSAAPLPFWVVLTCSATAASMAALCTNVLDMAKLRMQVERAGGKNHAGSNRFGYTNILHGVTRIVIDEGWGGIFRGAGARVAFQAPTTAIALAVFEQLKVWYGRAMAM